LLTRYAITTPTTSLHEHNELRKSSTLIARLDGGESIALVSDAGTPTVSDPGSHFISEAIARGVRVEAIPGPNAALAALSVSGLPSDGFVFLGFPPTKAKDRKMWIDRLRASTGTAVFYEAPHRIVSTLEEIQGRVGDAQVVIGREMTKAHEELVRGPISTILSSGLKTIGEFTVVINIGQLPERVASDTTAGPPGADLAIEFGRMTALKGLTRRQAIGSLARKYGVTAKQAYQAIEDAKKSGG